MITIRPYKDQDFEMIRGWWSDHNEIGPLPGMMTTNGTFVVEDSGDPIMTLTAFMTQSQEMSYIEGFCAKPGLDKDKRRFCGIILWNHCFEFLKDNGFKRVVTYTDKQKLSNRYEDFGMNVTMQGLTSLGRIL